MYRRMTLAGRIPLIHCVNVEVPPDCDWLQLSPAGTSHPCGWRLKNARLPPFRRSLSYQKEHVWPIAGAPFGGTGHAPVPSRLLNTIGTGLLLPSPQLAVAVVVTGLSRLKPSTGAKYRPCWLVYWTLT